MTMKKGHSRPNERVLKHATYMPEKRFDIVNGKAGCKAVVARGEEAVPAGGPDTRQFSWAVKRGEEEEKKQKRKKKQCTLLASGLERGSELSRWQLSRKGFWRSKEVEA